MGSTTASLVHIYIAAALATAKWVVELSIMVARGLFGIMKMGVQLPLRHLRHGMLVANIYVQWRRV